MYIIIIIWRVCYLTVIEKSRDLLNKNKNKNKIKMRGDVICQIQLGFVTFVIYFNNINILIVWTPHGVHTKLKKLMK